MTQQEVRKIVLSMSPENRDRLIRDMDDQKIVHDFLDKWYDRELYCYTKDLLTGHEPQPLAHRVRRNGAVTTVKEV